MSGQCQRLTVSCDMSLFLIVVLFVAFSMDSFFLRIRVNANMALAWKSSPAAYISQWTSPLLIIHGDSDKNVDVQV